MMVNVKYNNPEKAYPLAKYIGTEIISAIIKNIQFSIFLFANKYIPTNNNPVTKISR